MFPGLWGGLGAGLNDGAWPWEILKLRFRAGGGLGEQPRRGEAQPKALPRPLP